MKQGKPLQETDDRPLLSVLMPVYDESATVETMIARVLAVPLELEIIAVDDGSTDGTREILERLEGEHPNLRVCYFERNRGKGAALRTAIELARGRISLVQDADLEYDPQDYPELVKPIIDGETNVVYGSRRLRRDNVYPIDAFLMGSLLLTTLTNLLFGSRLTDEPTCYKVFRTEVLKSLPLRCQGFEFCPEVTAKALKRGERIVERPIRYDRRTVAEGKKIGWRDGVIGIWTLLKYKVID